MWVKNKRLIKYLKDNGLIPVAETLNGKAFFTDDVLLKNLIFTYTIKYECLPNKSMIPKRRLWRL